MTLLYGLFTLAGLFAAWMTGPVKLIAWLEAKKEFKQFSDIEDKVLREQLKFFRPNLFIFVFWLGCSIYNGMLFYKELG